MISLLGAAANPTFEMPSINYHQIAPILVVLGMAVVSVLVEAFVPREARRTVQLILTFATLIVAFILVVSLAGQRALAAAGAVAVDGPSLFLQGSLLILAIMAALLVAEKGIDSAGDAFAARANALPGSVDEREFTKRGWLTTEIWPLFLFSVGGMLLFVTGSDLLILFVGLEIMSLPLYLLAGMARRRRLLSQEAAMKYFLLGAFSSGFFLYGAAMLYGFAGTVDLGGIADAVNANAGQNGLLIAGMALISVGLFFKVAAVPFHQWAPDVYQGSPTSITSFMAACVKLAAFGAMLRIMYVALGGLRWDWRPMFWVIAILTMFVGVIIALTQTDVKRMLAYSSVAHAGFLLIAVIATNEQGLGGAMFYLLAYGVATIGAFGVVSLVRDSTGEATHLSSWAGLGKRSPWVAGAFTVFLLSFAGIPLTAGFIGKFAVFEAGVAGGAGWLVVAAVLASAIAVFFYGRVIVIMFFTEPQADGPTVVIPSSFTAIAIAAGLALTIVLGIIPQPFLDLAEKASIFVR
ncbi:MAG: NADH-quinone oxidoreductase subunit NuoN [Candidatus Nanopelagicales bacterium]